MRPLLPALCFGAALCGSALAAPVGLTLPPEPQFTLKSGAGSDAVANNCAACHSLDFILTQPPHMGEKFWDGEVTKMIKTFGAPISPSDQLAIVNYLKAAY